MPGTPLSAEELRKTDAYWRACSYLMLGMIYLRDNPLLKEPLIPEHIKNRFSDTGDPVRACQRSEAKERSTL